MVPCKWDDLLANNSPDITAVPVSHLHDGDNSSHLPFPIGYCKDRTNWNNSKEILIKLTLDEKELF